ncbi:MAG: glycosyltransferase family 39 protein [Acetobacteraceae bacterium]|nr:glycosyltransferase family 39 protein [Acetobacteraceae bacterium]
MEVPPRPAARRFFWLLALALLPVLTLGLRWASFLPSVIDWDESLYVLQAREWLRGNWPLSGVWDMHPVGAPAFIAGAFLLLGESVEAVRLLGAACVTATGFGLFALVRFAGGPPALGYAAALIYAAHSILLGGQASNTEILFAPFLVGALGVGLRGALAPGAPGWGALLALGALVGPAVLIKPVATPEGCLAFGLLTFPALWRKQLKPRRFLAMAAAYAALCAAPTLLVGGIYALRGEFDIWFESTILAPFTYAASGVSGEQAAWRITTAALALRWALLLGLVGLAGLAAADAPIRRLTAFGLLWLATASVAVAGPGMFFPHYFLILLPPLSLLAALGVLMLARLARPGHAGLLMAALVGLLSADIVASDLAPRLSRGFALGSPDTPRRMAALMNEELRPGETIFVPNYQPIVYFLTDARLPTRLPFPVHLTGSFANLAGVDTDAEVRRILESRPRFIVLDRSEWFAMRPSAMAMLTEALEEGYEIAASFAEERGTVELWRRVEAE